MRILLLLKHEIEAYIRCRLLSELGHEVYETGAYLQPAGEGPHRKRPALPNLPYSPEFVQLKLQCPDERLLPEIVDFFDVIIASHPQTLLPQWGTLRDSGKRIIWSSVGQSTAGDEAMASLMRREGLEIVRYSPVEDRIPNYCGADAMIPFGVPDDFLPWVGGGDEAVCFVQSIKQRGTHTGWTVLEPLLAAGVPISVYGPGNEAIGPAARGLVTYGQQVSILSQAKSVLAFGTHPASVTLNFIEAWMAGAPVIAAGPVLGHPMQSGYSQQTYWVPEIISHGENGFVADTPAEFAGLIEDLAKDPAGAAAIGAAGRARALSIFGFDVVKAKWARFLAGGGDLG